MDNYDELIKLFTIENEIINDNNICIICKQPFNIVCDYCGVTYNREQYGCFDLFNYSFIKPIKYKKISHFQDVLDHLQARESRIIPEIIITTIKNEVDNDITKIDKNLVLKVLKKNKWTKYVENQNFIMFIVTNVMPVYIPKKVEDLLILYFKDIITVYDSIKLNRKNFLNYYYVIYKLLEMMGEHHFLIYIPKLKSKYRLRAHDKIWESICEMLNFEYIKTV